ncbi:hypothetical protein PUNSTDRAFT_58299 [Punctularia strigosozonata HHB-11173 SS5]|uniref:uncharacterized protein n=1 Tax=Punctularia strigosozonata (strain HHB-11173) TaxID=741275 RepID=UPI0004417097|nr:uncharacterized protein PUNSTDRAFT_58299 [Punctularia strigosozonata HHB-11173 SS5]EIN13788.1 hypothetical protein PUNSTDRAFT_58299 [Punctularia strigosozonata HHB-11173 SS5]
MSQGVGAINVPAPTAPTAAQTRDNPTHKPIPLTTIFSRKAAPLYLPKLDKVISLLPKPHFRLPPSKVSSKHGQLFPPMDLLAMSGRSVEDLENNHQVTPSWRNRTSILSGLVDIIVGVASSSALVTFYSIQGLVNTLQIFALLLSTLTFRGTDLEDKWRQLFLGTIPNVLALNFASTLTQSLILLMIFMAISTALLYYFHRATKLVKRYKRLEGFQKVEQKGGLIVFVTFLLTVLYLPLSTMAVHVLVWSDDLWAVPNPYTNATTYPPVVPSLGPADEWREPLDFCYTTTMKRNEINFAPLVVILSAIVFGLYTVWFPIRLRQVVEEGIPKVDKYTELGKSRSRSDMDREYQRLLERDRGPFTFLYSSFRRGYANFESKYLLAKLSSLLIIAVVNPNNCLFRTLNHATLAVIKQSLLLAATIIFLGQQCYLRPFVDPVNNASEVVSRVNYVVTAFIALSVTLQIPGYKILNGPMLYLLYILTYVLSAYFLIVQISYVQRFIKIVTRRVDFSIDIFSPRLDISASSPHTRRRIWQEAISTLILTSEECKIPKEQDMTFAQAPDSEYPPYLLNFMRTVGERHVENLKILREVGLDSYNRALAVLYGPNHNRFRRLVEDIQRNYLGPDSYWRDPGIPPKPGFTRYFGNSWWIPFPPTLVMRYDDGPLVVLQDPAHLRLFRAQNSTEDILRRKRIRMALRSLHGQIVTWPYTHVQARVTSVGGWMRRWRYSADKTTRFERCVFVLKHRGCLVFEGSDFGSGFDVELKYTHDISVNGDIIGITDDYELTPQLAQFLTLNEALVESLVERVDIVLTRYREVYWKECQLKSQTMSYLFLAFVYDRPRHPAGLAESSVQHERNLILRQLMVGSEEVFKLTCDRLAAVSESRLATWWYIFWDDLWRRNHDSISGLQTHASDFDPHSPTSIAYSPLPRPALETFLTQRGLLPRKNGFFHAGFLNKIYLRLNDIAFQGSSTALILHLGDNKSELDMAEADRETLAAPSSLGTGGGTDHDDEDYSRPRPTYRWEGIFSDTPHHHRPTLRAKLMVALGISPRWPTAEVSAGLSLDVRLDNGRYILLHRGNESDSGASTYTTTASKFI